MLVYILLAILAFIALLLVVAAMQPSDFRIVRSATIDAPPSVLFELIDDFHHWERWSPWAKMDPNMKQTYEGQPFGVGAIHTWNGNNKVGEGRTTITGGRANESVQIRLDFVRPFQCSNDVEFKLVPLAGGTQVNWIMTGKNNFMGKLFGLFMNMDKMVGKDFETGLSNLKNICESAG